jgi:hypothetical protein
VRRDLTPSGQYRERRKETPMAIGEQKVRRVAQEAALFNIVPEARP